MLIIPLETKNSKGLCNFGAKKTLVRAIYDM